MVAKIQNEKAILHPLAWGVIVPLALCLVTPLLVHSSFIFPFISTKTFWFRSLVEGAAAFYVVLAFRVPLYRPKLSLAMKAMVGYLAVAIIASLFGENLYRSFWGNIERGEGLLTLLHVFAYAFLCAQVLKSQKLWECFFAGSLFVAVLVALYGIGQRWGVDWVLHSGDTRLSATIGNASFLAGYLLMHTYIALWFALSSRPLAWRITAGIIYLFLWYVVYNTGTRGALIAGAVVTAAMGLFLAFRAREHRIGWRIAASSTVILFIIFTLNIFLPRNASWVQKSPTLNRIASISFSDITTQSRMLTWESSLKGLRDRPLLGYGYENYNIPFNRYFSPLIYRDAGSQVWFDRAHNVIFDIALTSGILGLLAYALMFGMAFRVAWVYIRSDAYPSRIVGIVFSSLLFAHLLQNFFVFDILATYIPLMLVFGFLGMAPRIIPHAAPSAASLAAKPISGVMPVIGAAAFFFFAWYQFNYAPSIVNREGLDAMRLRMEGRAEEATEKFIMVLRKNTYQAGEIRLKLAEHALDLRAGTGSVTDELAARTYEYAIQEVLKNIESSPKDAQLYLYLMNLYYSGSKYQMDRLALIERVGKEALALSPTRPQTYYLLGQGAAGRREYEKAVEYFKTAVDLNPVVVESHWNLSVAYRLANQKDGERKEYETLAQMGFGYAERENLSDLDLTRLTQGYASLGEYTKLAGLYEVFVRRYPTNVEYRAKLAAAYKSAGDFPRARAAAEELLKLKPEMNAEIEKFLLEITQEETKRELK
ncbi:MAG: O-antigen ligase family protein [Patescibacteria group bacterium]